MPHPFDLPATDQELALAASDRPDLLGELLAISRRTFGFFNRNFSYTITYPWAGAILEGLPRGSRVLDIGAGINPLPIFLAERGVCTDCVDSHRTVRSLPADESWTAWGFFDYASLHPDLAAYHCGITEFVPSHAYDAIYAVCSMTHMTAAVRRQALNRSRQWLRTDGDLLIALDVVHGDDKVWNYAEGVEIEPPAHHGTISDVIDELVAREFRIVENRLVRHLPRNRPDLLLLRCRSARGREAD